MALLAIPVELKLAIADALEPRHVFRLGFTCRELHRSLASTLARHKRLWQQYSHIDPQNPNCSIQRVANDVALNPHLAYYIEILHLPKNGEYTRPNPASDSTNNLIQHYLRVIETQRSLWYDFDDWRDAWMYIILNSRRSRMVGNFLIAAAPNLRVLRFEHDCDNMDTVLFNFVSRVGAASSDPTQAPHLPLRKLKLVELICDRWSDELGREVNVDEDLSDWSECFRKLPSVELVLPITPDGDVS